MNAPTQSGIQLAEGFRFTDRLTSSYRLAYYGCSVISNIDGSERQELLHEEERRSCARCLSPDGNILYYVTDQIYARDLATGEVRKLNGIPHEPPFDRLWSLQCSPDNRTLVFRQTAIPRMVRGSATASRVRLCHASTDGTDFRILYVDPPEYRLCGTQFCWQQGFALLCRSQQTNDKAREELCKLNLDSGELELIGRFADTGWNLALHPAGKEAAWSTYDFGRSLRGKQRTLPTPKSGIYLCSLDSGVSRMLVPEGISPSWSPDGKTIAFMNDQHKLCLLDRDTVRIRDLIWFEPPKLSYKDRQDSYAVPPAWSPDGRMLWFALTQARKLPPPRSIAEACREGARYLGPILDSLNPNRISHSVSYKRHCYQWKTGIIDFVSKQVVLSNGYMNGVDWLPHAA